MLTFKQNLNLTNFKKICSIPAGTEEYFFRGNLAGMGFFKNLRGGDDEGPGPSMPRPLNDTKQGLNKQQLSRGKKKTKKLTNHAYIIYILGGAWGWDNQAKQLLMRWKDPPLPRDKSGFFLHTVFLWLS